MIHFAENPDWLKCHCLDGPDYLGSTQCRGFPEAHVEVDGISDALVCVDHALDLLEQRPWLWDLAKNDPWHPEYDPSDTAWFDVILDSVFGEEETD